MLYKIRGVWWDLRRRWQRFLRGYAWTDVWNLDSWFINTVEPMLRHLQKEGMGYPFGYEPEEWAERLGQMADHLHLMDEENVVEEVFGGDYIAREINDVMKDHCEKFFEMFSKDFYNLWD